MPNLDQDALAILREIVQRLEAIEAKTDHLLAEIAILQPRTIANRMDAIGLTAQANQSIYDEIRKKIDALK